MLFNCSNLQNNIFTRLYLIIESVVTSSRLSINIIENTQVCISFFSIGYLTPRSTQVITGRLTCNVTHLTIMLMTHLMNLGVESRTLMLAAQGALPLNHIDLIYVLLYTVFSCHVFTLRNRAIETATSSRLKGKAIGSKSSRFDLKELNLTQRS